jgi:hypothetical protein
MSKASLEARSTLAAFLCRQDLGGILLSGDYAHGIVTRPETSDPAKTQFLERIARIGRGVDDGECAMSPSPE